VTKRERAHVEQARRHIAAFFGSTEGDPSELFDAENELRSALGIPTRRNPLDGMVTVSIAEVSKGPNRRFEGPKIDP
jgi:hypothetical protein